MMDAEFLEKIVGIYSPSGSESRVAQVIVSEMIKMGFRAHVDGAGNAVGEIGSGSKTILMAGHIDTVPGEIPVRIKDGNLWGRGSVDAKGPFAAFVIAASRARLEGKRVIVAGCVEEEAATSKGARFLIGKFDPDYLIIGEPSGTDSLVLGYKGRLLLRYEDKKTISHTAGKEEGVIDEAVCFYTAVKGFCHAYNEGKEKIFETLQCSMREISSGSDGFSDSVSMTVGFRIPFGFDTNVLKEYCAGIKGSAAFEYYGEEIPIKAEKNTPLVRAFLASVRKEGLSPRFRYKTGTSDMNILGHAYQVPILTYGPGDASLDHTPEEHISLEEYNKGIRVLVAALENL